MLESLKPVAKAVAGFLTPLVVAFVAGLLDRAGMDVPVDPGWVETFIVSALTALTVWATRNTPKPAG